MLGYLALESGRQNEARHELTAAWHGLGTGMGAGPGTASGSGSGTGPETARGIAERMAWLCLIESDADEAVAWARRGIEAGPGGRVSLLRDELTLGLALSGRPEEAAEVVSGLPEHGPYRGPDELDGLFARGALRMWNGAYDAARRDLQDVVVAHRAHGLRGLVAPALGYLADTAYRAGRWNDAVAHSARAVSLAEDTDHRSMLAMAHAVAAAPLSGRGDFDAAQTHVTKALHHAELLADTSDLGYARTALAQLRAAQGDHLAVVEALRPLAGSLTGHRAAVDEPGVFPWRQLLIEALLRTGRTDEAEAVLTPYEKLAAARGRWPDLAAAARCRGLLAAAQGDPDHADHAFRTGLDHCAPHPHCWEAALLHFAHGSFLRRTSRRGAAAARLDTAWGLFVHAGAEPYQEMCRLRAHLRAHRPAPTLAAHPAGSHCRATRRPGPE
ncbi:hypothetical protein OG883_40175 [Streptomyces sp. NBC_01142]|uniref:tetratricopeptide repeat protein n=1 Tax=Streptomyces sp. NBC_01142 TaxID=2975865 RepID=UPI0022539650|nr:hypothetical protein [Streptomyces sp. NBC_01142]MCX4825919.1 hypothetical protein [Streptomyces sp. NBC_01142]